MKPTTPLATSNDGTALPLKAAAVLAVFAGLGFGIPGAIGLKYLADTGEVWTFMGFPTYGHGPFERVGIRSSVPLMSAFVAVCAAEVAAGGLLWRRPRAGMQFSHAILPLEMIFWVGFALPFGPPLGLVRTLLVISQRRGNTAPGV